MEKERLKEIANELEEPIKKFISDFEEHEKESYSLRVYEDIGTRRSLRDSYKLLEVPDFNNEAIVGKVGKFFRDSAEWLADTGGFNGFYITRDSQRLSSRWPVYIEEDNLVEDSNYEKLLREYELIIVDIVRSLIRHTGSFKFEDEAYRLVMEEKFHRHFNIPREFLVIAPLHNVDSLPQIELDKDFELPERFENDSIQSIKIRKLTQKERSGMKTWYERGSVPSEGYKDFNAEYGIVTKIRGMSPQAGRQISKKAVTGLRLFKPGLEELGADSTYQSADGWLNYRTNSVYINGGGPLNTELADLYGLDNYRESYSLTKEEGLDFEEFWSLYNDQIRVNTVFENRNDDISRAIRRFNELYRQRNYGDRIIDISIALESTLLKDIGKTESFSFRMPLRASLMLEDRVEAPEDFVFDFLKEFYKQRSRIVHADKELDIIEVQETEYHPGSFVSEARSILASILRYYFEKEIEGKSRVEANQDLDEEIRD